MWVCVCDMGLYLPSLGIFLSPNNTPKVVKNKRLTEENKWLLTQKNQILIITKGKTKKQPNILVVFSQNGLTLKQK